MAKIVILVHGGVVQSIISDTLDTEVLLLDSDWMTRAGSNSDPDKTQRFQSPDGEIFDAMVGHECDYMPEQVESYYQQACI